MNYHYPKGIGGFCLIKLKTTMNRYIFEGRIDEESLNKFLAWKKENKGEYEFYFSSEGGVYHIALYLLRILNEELPTIVVGDQISSSAFMLLFNYKGVIVFLDTSTYSVLHLISMDICTTELQKLPLKLLNQLNDKLFEEYTFLTTNQRREIKKGNDVIVNTKEVIIGARR